MKIKFKRMHPDAVLPSHSKEGDAGLDLTVTEINTPRPFYREHRYGLAVEIPKGYVGLLFPRSSICKFAERLTNSVGVIDSGFRGEISAVFDVRQGMYGDNYLLGHRTAQIVIVPHVVAETLWSDELSETERGEGSYGHTGK